MPSPEFMPSAKYSTHRNPLSFAYRMRRCISEIVISEGFILPNVRFQPQSFCFIRSGSLATGGEVFVLEMGDPVSIMQLARDMIELSGLRPEHDIAIEITGRRPGEKLHEDLFNPYERPQATPAEKIQIAERERLAPEVVEAMFAEIGLLVLEGDAAALARKVTELSVLRTGSPVDAAAASGDSRS